MPSLKTIRTSDLPITGEVAVFIMKKQKAFSLVEVVLAIAIFMVVAVTGVTTVLQSFSVNKLSEEQSNADLFVLEGIEAVRSIRNQSWENLVVSSETRGLKTTNGYWEFDGSEDVKDKYTRTILLSSVNRDVNGNIVESGGLIDPDTVKVTSSVSWNFSGPRDDEITRSIYLTNFRKLITGDGILIYSDGNVNPVWRSYSRISDTFNIEGSITGDVGLTYVLKTSPIKKEAVAGYVSANGTLNILCFDGSDWHQEWVQNVGGNGSTRRFDISYETSSGDVVVLYNNDNSNQLGYRTKSGASTCGSANWNVSSYTPLRTTGIVHWIKTALDGRVSSNLISVAWADANSDLSAAVWSGSSLTNEPGEVSENSLEFVTTPQDVDDFDIEYESLSGDVMLIWANSSGNNGTNGVRYRTCNGGISNCTWSSVIVPPTWGDDATNLSTSSNPRSDEIVFASLGNAGNDLQAGYWDGSSWTNTANLDTSGETPLAGTQLVSVGWLQYLNITRSIIVYHDANASNISFCIGDGKLFQVQRDYAPSPAFMRSQKWYEVQMDPKNSNMLILTVSDGNNDLFSKRLVMTAPPNEQRSDPVLTWTDSDEGAAIEDVLPKSISSPFSFAYWRNL